MNISDESPMHRIYWAYHTNNKIFNYVNGYNLTKTNVYLFAIKVSVRKNCDSALLWLQCVTIPSHIHICTPLIKHIQYCFLWNQ